MQPYGSPMSRPGSDPRRSRNLQLTRDFMSQPSASRAPMGDRTRPSTYPDVQGFANTPMGRMLLRNIIERMGQPQGRGAQGRPASRR